MTDFRLLTGALLGASLTLGLGTIAQTDKAPPERIQCEGIRTEALRIEGELAALPRIEKRLAEIESTRGEDIWARAVDSKLDQIENELMLQNQLRQLR